MPPYKKSLSSIKLPSISNITKSNQLMGCASSQAAEIKAQQNSGTEPTDPSNTNEADNDVGKENMKENDDNKENVASNKYPPPEAFEIPLDTDDPNSNENIIKKYPPKRLQRLVEQSQQQQHETGTTIEDLEEKLAKAEIRRQKFLQQRVDTVLSLAQPITIIKKDDVEQFNIDDNNDDEMLTITTINNENIVENVNNDHNYKDDEEYENSNRNNHNSNDNNNDSGNEINHLNIRNYTRVATPATLPSAIITTSSKKSVIYDNLNKDEKYRSPGDGDESKENLQI